MENGIYKISDKMGIFVADGKGMIIRPNGNNGGWSGVKGAKSLPLGSEQIAQLEKAGLDACQDIVWIE